MDMSTWFLFIAVALLAIASPGPAILLAISNSITYGMRSVVLSSLGNITGLFILSSAAILGLGAILKTSSVLFFIIKLVGAVYLIYLGVRQWCSKTNLFDQKENTFKKQRLMRSYYLEGFFVAITNPKAVLFFTALFPQFIDLRADLVSQFFIMTLSFMVLSLLILLTYGLLAFRARHWFSTSKRVKWFNRAIGGLFVFIGVGLLQFKSVK